MRVAERSALLVHVDAEAADARHADGEVALLLVGELLDLPRRHELLGQRLQILRAQRRVVERHRARRRCAPSADGRP